jgi:hypothetical protein
MSGTGDEDDFQITVGAVGKTGTDKVSTVGW